MLLAVFVEWSLLLLVNGQASTRVCSDPSCTASLFTAETHTQYPDPDTESQAIDERFLSYKPGDLIDIYSIDISGRQDLWYGQLNGKNGFVFNGHFRPNKFDEFMINAAQENRNVYVVGSDNSYRVLFFYVESLYMLLAVFVEWSLLLLVNGQASTRVCSDPSCTASLFTAETHTQYPDPDTESQAIDERFLSYKPGDLIDIYSIDISGRQDLWYGQLNGKNGFVFNGHFRPNKFDEFMINAAQENRNVYVVGSDNSYRSEPAMQLFRDVIYRLQSAESSNTVSDEKNNGQEDEAVDEPQETGDGGVITDAPVEPAEHQKELDEFMAAELRGEKHWMESLPKDASVEDIGRVDRILHRDMQTEDARNEFLTSIEAGVAVGKSLTEILDDYFAELEDMEGMGSFDDLQLGSTPAPPIVQHDVPPATVPPAAVHEVTPPPPAQELTAPPAREVTTPPPPVEEVTTPPPPAQEVTTPPPPVHKATPPAPPAHVVSTTDVPPVHQDVPPAEMPAPPVHLETAPASEVPPQPSPEVVATPPPPQASAVPPAVVTTRAPPRAEPVVTTPIPPVATVPPAAQPPVAQPPPSTIASPPVTQHPPEIQKPILQPRENIVMKAKGKGNVAPIHEQGGQQGSGGHGHSHGGSGHGHNHGGGHGHSHGNQDENAGPGGWSTGDALKALLEEEQMQLPPPPQPAAAAQQGHGHSHGGHGHSHGGHSHGQRETAQQPQPSTPPVQQVTQPPPVQIPEVPQAPQQEVTQPPLPDVEATDEINDPLLDPEIQGSSDDTVSEGDQDDDNDHQEGDHDHEEGHGHSHGDGGGGYPEYPDLRALEAEREAGDAVTPPPNEQYCETDTCDEYTPPPARVVRTKAGPGYGSTLKSLLKPVIDILRHVLAELKMLTVPPGYQNIIAEKELLLSLVGIAVLTFNIFWHFAAPTTDKSSIVDARMFAELSQKAKALEVENAAIRNQDNCSQNVMKSLELERANVAEANSQITSLKEELHRVTESKEILENENSTLKNNEETLEKKQKSLRAELTSIKEDRATIDDKSSKLEEHLLEEQKTIIDLRDRLATATEEAKMHDLQKNSLQELIDQQNEKINGLNQDIATLKEQIGGLETDLQGAQDDCASKDKELAVLRGALEKLNINVDANSGESNGESLSGWEVDVDLDEDAADRKEKVQRFMDTARLHADVKTLEEEKERLKKKIADDEGSRRAMEKTMEELKLKAEEQRLLSSESTKKQEAAQIRFDALTEHFSKKEMELQKQLSEYQYLSQQRRDKLGSAETELDEVKNQREESQRIIDNLHQELKDKDREFKRDQQRSEKEKHEHWQARRAIERTLESLRNENEFLRRKLISATGMPIDGASPSGFDAPSNNSSDAEIAQFTARTSPLLQTNAPMDVLAEESFMNIPAPPPSAPPTAFPQPLPFDASFSPQAQYHSDEMYAAPYPAPAPYPMRSGRFSRNSLTGSFRRGKSRGRTPSRSPSPSTRSARHRRTPSPERRRDKSKGRRGERPPIPVGHRSPPNSREPPPPVLASSGVPPPGSYQKPRPRNNKRRDDRAY